MIALGCYYERDAPEITRTWFGMIALYAIVIKFSRLPGWITIRADGVSRFLSTPMTRTPGAQSLEIARHWITQDSRTDIEQYCVRFLAVVVNGRQVTQSVERRTLEAEVQGSKPVLGTWLWG